VQELDKLVQQSNYLGPQIGLRKGPRNPDFVVILDKMREIHDKKSQDYAKDDNVYSNFEFAALVSDIFTDPVDRVFATMIAIKLARLAELGKGKSPKNESVEDSHLDLATYCTIWAAYRKRHQSG